MTWASCNHDGPQAVTFRPDLSPLLLFPEDPLPDLAGDMMQTDDFCIAWDECGHTGCYRCCSSDGFTPPFTSFPLQRDPLRHRDQMDQHLRRDGNGSLVLDGTAMTGTYTLMFDEGCESFNVERPTDTEWGRLRWEADTPAGTSITVRARSGDNHDPSTWGANAWTPPAKVSPLDLRAQLRPNLLLDGLSRAAVYDRVLLVEIVLETNQRGVTPALKALVLGYTCNCYSPG